MSTQHPASEDDEGTQSATSQPRHTATRNPSEVPFKGWKAIGGRVFTEIGKDHVSIISAGVAYYFFLALFPTLIAAISIYGLVTEPSQVQQQMQQMTSILPQQASQMLSGILSNIAGQAGQTLSWSLALSLLFTLWSAHQGTSAVFQGINIAYDETDERGFFKSNALTLLFTLGGIIIGILSTILVVAFPALVDSLGLPSIMQTLLSWLRWLLLGGIIIGVLGLTYKVAPDRNSPDFQWVSRGAIVATILWLGGSLLFSFYINNFSNYANMYGSFAAVIILMLWFYLTAYVILLGAEVNSELEQQAGRK